MSSMNTVGTDGKYPIIDVEPYWRIWQLSQVWLGEEGENRYVPKVNDWVVDTNNAIFYNVDHLDETTLIPTLRALTMTSSGSFTDTEKLIGVGPGSPSEVFRVYLNTTVYPYTLAVDTGLGISGSMSSYAKLFIGTDITETGRVLSKVYDASGNFVTTAVQLETIAVDSHTNYLWKAVKRCHCTEKLEDGEIVTVVAYADDGHVVYRRELKIENTNTIMDTHVGIKYIEDISIESIWLANGSQDTLNYPLNLPMSSLNAVGVVHYSNGDELRLPINGTKFSMYGLAKHVSSISGEVVPMVLKYELSSDEYALAASGANQRFITKPLKLITTNPNNSIQVKLFCYPEWQGATVGYTLRFFLYNMDRNVWYDVTNYVQLAENTGAYNPKLYRYLQRKAVVLNLHDVSTNFIPFNHTQVFDIYLLQAPSADAVDSWNIVSQDAADGLRYGVGVYGRVNATNTLVNFAADFTTLEDWLEAYYYLARPLVDVVNETKAPAPTHFTTSYLGQETTFPISSWNEDLSIGTGLLSSKNVYIRFTKVTPTITQELGIAAAILKKF